MRTLIFHRRTFRLIHRCVCCAAIGVYLCAASGGPFLLPTAARLAAGDSWDGIPFPCQYSRCGCATAEQCYLACCCHKPAERLAWAKLRGVTLKMEWVRELLAANKPEQKANNSSTGRSRLSAAHCENQSACCRQQETVTPTCCATEPELTACCAADSTANTNATEKNVEPERPANDSSHWPDIITPSCAGMMLQWSTLGAVLPVRVVSLPASLDGFPETRDILSDTANDLDWPPDVPPPRR